MYGFLSPIKIERRRINEIEEMMFKEGKNMSPDRIQDLRQDFQKFRSKIENGTIVKRISTYAVYSSHLLRRSLPIQFILNLKLFSFTDASNEVSPAHRKLKYRRLSDAKHKEVREKFMKIWYVERYFVIVRIR